MNRKAAATPEAIRRQTDRETWSNGIYMENWKDIDGFEHYVVSNTGLVKHKRTNRISHGWLCHWGYKIVTLYQDGKKHGISMHNLVAKAFIGQVPHGFVVNHIDGNKLNNDIANLEIVTISENNKHAYRIGLKKPTKCFDKSNGMYKHGREEKEDDKSVSTGRMHMVRRGRP
jgi:hypothetical protein